MMLMKIIECENRIIQERKLLNDLLEQCQTEGSSELIKMKMDELQAELVFMSRQLELMKKEYVPEVQRQQEVEVKPEVQWQREDAGQPKVQYQYMEQPKKKDMEKTIGKSLMGVFASLLIFVSFILFATLVVPYLTDGMKMFLMFGISFAFAIGGNLLLRKDSRNKWFLSITGCGMGAVYISLLVSMLYFKAIGEITLYICFLIWAVVICVLSRLRSRIFLAIGQIGVVVSVIFGVWMCGTNNDTSKVLFIVIYAILAQGVFYISHLHKEYEKNLLNHIFIASCLGLLWFLTQDEYALGEALGIAASVLVTVFSCFMLAVGVLYFKVKKDTIAFGVINLIYYMIMSWSFQAHTEGCVYVLSVAAVLLLVAMEWRLNEAWGEENSIFIGKIILQTGLFVILMLQIADIEFLWKYSSVAIPALVCLLYGYIKNKKIYRIAGLSYAVWFVIFFIDNYWYLVWGVAIFAVLIALNCLYKESYHTAVKLVMYPFFLIFINTNMDRIITDLGLVHDRPLKLLILTIFAIINICMMKIPALNSHPQTGLEEKGFFRESGIFHIIQMFAALNLIGMAYTTMEHIWAIMLGLMLFVVNIRNLLKKFGDKWGSIYVGTKLFVFFLVVIASFSAPDYLFSIVALLFAIAFIAAGFVAEIRTGRKVKAIRIYGLVLSLISIFKLLMLDIHYDNVFSLALSFFVSGILCFAISFIYNQVDKKLTGTES